MGSKSPNIFFVSDYIVIGSDSGRIVILEYIPKKNILEKVHQETFGKSGCRRIVPGQYLAIDPKGRAVMIGKNFVTHFKFPCGSPKSVHMLFLFSMILIIVIL